MHKSFQYAGEGLAWVFNHHRNFRIYIGVGIVATILAYFLNIPKTEFVIILFTVALCLIAELLNTAIEEVTDLITIRWSHQAKVAKDVGAALSLVAAITAAIIGILIFTPYLVGF
jgi:undecaprenol kinase/diacylglycerol kinase (ATP)